MNWLSLCADILTVISAIVTVVSVFTIKSYYNKIVRQYSVEKLTLAEQYIHNSIEIMQKIKRIYSSDTRGLSVKKIGGLYLDIEEKDFEHIQDIVENANELEKRAPYDKLVTTKFAK